MCESPHRMAIQLADFAARRLSSVLRLQLPWTSRCVRRAAPALELHGKQSSNSSIAHAMRMCVGLGRAFLPAALCRSLERSAPVPHLPLVPGAWHGTGCCILNRRLLDRCGPCLHAPSCPVQQQRAAALSGTAGQACTPLSCWAGQGTLLPKPRATAHLQPAGDCVPHV